MRSEMKTSLSAFTLTALMLLGSCVGTMRTPVPYDIGVVAREVTTDSDEAQLWFDRGLALRYGFNSEEAVRCFERAAAADPSCAMAYWGQAYAHGPDYNAPEMAPEAIAGACAAIEKARANLAGAAPVERGLIEALATRYAPAPAERAALDRAYADAMTALYAKFPNDADVAALTAEAVMQLRPWKLWSHEGVPAPETPRVRAILEPALARWPNHPALCHLYIHAMEASPEVERAVPAAERLEQLVPGAGHLVHMPSHIYTWTGRYADVVRVNLDAVEVDRAYVRQAGRDNIFTLYRVHNYHFVAYGGMWEGRRELALDAARELVEEIPDTLLAQFPDFTDVFKATPYHVMVRFGMWEEILQEPEPKAPELSATRAVWRYARCLALAALGRVQAAEAEQQAFLAAKAAVPESRLLFQNPVSQILRVAEQVVAGEIEYRRGNKDKAFEHLRSAAKLDRELNYDEPWGWMEPAEHALGALLVDSGRYEEALAVYQANLERYPENGWALHGLAECLRNLGREAEAREASERFERAWERADVTIPGSCYCRTRPAA